MIYNWKRNKDLGRVKFQIIEQENFYINASVEISCLFYILGIWWQYIECILSWGYLLHFVKPGNLIFYQNEIIMNADVIENFHLFCYFKMDQNISLILIIIL